MHFQLSKMLLLFNFLFIPVQAGQPYTFLSLRTALSETKSLLVDKYGYSS